MTLSEREAKAALLAPPTGEQAEVMRKATFRALETVKAAVKADRRQAVSGWLFACHQAIRTYRGGHRLSDEQVAMLTVYLMYLRVRDDAWARMDPEYGEAHIRMWTDLTKRAWPEFVPPVASLLAFVAWQQDDTALAHAALDRALAANPEYRMAELLRQVINSGTPPSMARLPMSPEEVAESATTKRKVSKMRKYVHRDSVERALNNAKRNGWVERWERHPEGGHVVDIRRWGPERFKTNRETYAFCLGLAAVDCNPKEEGTSHDDARKALAAAREYATATGRPLGVSAQGDESEGDPGAWEPEEEGTK